MSNDPETLTRDVLADLRRPFSVDAVRFKPQATNQDKTKALAVPYIDARLVAARLDHVVGPAEWHESYRLPFEATPQIVASLHFPCECSLTVLGVTKIDVGIYQKDKPDVLTMKSAYSDAFKRAAVKFGVGAFLYALGSTWAPVKTYQKGERTVVEGFSDAGMKQLRGAYSKWLASGQPFGDALDHGFVVDDPDADTSGTTDQPATAATTGNGSGASEPAGRPRMISQSQRNKMWATAGELGLSEEQVRSIVAVVVNTADACESTKAIPTVKYQDVLRSMALVAKDMADGGSMYVDKMSEWRTLNSELATILENAVALNVGAGGDAD